jgi:hypothetical protein
MVWLIALHPRRGQWQWWNGQGSSYYRAISCDEPLPALSVAKCPLRGPSALLGEAGVGHVMNQAIELYLTKFQLAEKYPALPCTMLLRKGTISYITGSFLT